MFSFRQHNRLSFFLFWSPLQFYNHCGEVEWMIWDEVIIFQLNKRKVKVFSQIIDWWENHEDNKIARYNLYLFNKTDQITMISPMFSISCWMYQLNIAILEVPFDPLSNPSVSNITNRFCECSICYKYFNLWKFRKSWKSSLLSWFRFWKECSQWTGSNIQGPSK